MRDENVAPHRVSRGNFRDMYWTARPIHHASVVQRMQPATRAICLPAAPFPGREKESRGCLLEMTWGGKEPIQLPTGETRTFLEEGDEVIMRGYCEREGAARIGFGECRGVILG